jgi:ribosome-binding factor A
MGGTRKEKIEKLIHKFSAEYINEEANKKPLITVTGVQLTENFEHAKIFVSVFPEKGAPSSLLYLSRKAPDLRHHIARETRLKTPPLISFHIDPGEENRKRIDEIIEGLN